MSLLQRAMLSRRVGRLVLEHIEGLELVVLPDVFNPAVFRTSPLLAEAIAANVVNGSRVLDVGTGSGVAAIRAAACGGDVTAIDINPEAIRCARINALLNHVDAQDRLTPRRFVCAGRRRALRRGGLQPAVLPGDANQPA